LNGFREKEKAAKRAFLYRNFRPENPPKWDGTQPLRFKSEPKKYAWNDAVMGELSAGAEAIDDFVLIKSDGYPTYNFAHIIDDAEMKITHIIRGQEFISSMPNYLNLYDALELPRPVFAHLPHILNETGNKKLGKRDGAKDAMEYLRDGILVEALVNFLASMGWNDGTEDEIFSKDELISKFTLERVGRSSARFDERRLVWMNGQWIKKLSDEELYERTVASNLGATFSGTRSRPLGQDAVPKKGSEAATGFWGPAGRKASEEERRGVLAVVHDRLKTLADLPALSEYFFSRPAPKWEMTMSNKQLKKIPREDLIKLLDTAGAELGKIVADEWNEEKIQSVLNALLAATDSKPAVLFSIIRYALSWAPFSPGLPETMRLLGKDETLGRIRDATTAKTAE
jgi:glutamyl-tRNA synthetase